MARAGAVTTNSLSMEVRSGNKSPRLVGTPAGMLNAIGLQNVGLEAYLNEKAPFLRDKKVPIIANIYGHTPDEFAELARRLEEADAADAIEANLSCPNVHDARASRGPCLVAQVPEDVAEYTKTIRSATKLPLFVKLTPNIIDISSSMAWILCIRISAFVNLDARRIAHFVDVNANELISPSWPAMRANDRNPLRAISS